MAAEGSKRPVPAGLGQRGKALWRDVLRSYELRVDELRVLEDACREIDLIDRMHEELASGPLMTPGRYAGMRSVHPMLAEIRQHRALFAKLAEQLGLPTETEPTAAGGRPRSVQARAAAQARWQHR